MNIYDTVNKLAQEIKESEEYNNYKKAKEAISLNPDLNIKIKEFEKARYNSQLKIMQTGETDEKELANMQKMYAKLIENEEAKKYLDSEAKFNILMTDINKIIGDSIKDVVS